MKFFSTRDESKKNPVSISEAILSGLAPDGGLFVPEDLPEISSSELGNNLELNAFSKVLLRPFFEGDSMGLDEDLEAICNEAMNFKVPLWSLEGDTDILELFHGPTAAFKDVGARFLSGCMSRIAQKKSIELTVMVATSGDTGGAVASAFWKRPGVRVAVLYPKNGVSPLQEKQLTCWGENVQAIRVDGTFDDCQRVVKEAFGSSKWRKELGLTSANSINVGRLLPQMIYYARYAFGSGNAKHFFVPTGNLGNALACFWAKQMGCNIGKVYLALNANRPLFDFIETGEFEAQKSIRTLANAMDVGNPSNLERLIHLFGSWKRLRPYTSALCVSDEEIKHEIKRVFAHSGRIICPHTATASFFAKKYTLQENVVVATAHPYKFHDIISPVIDKTPPIPSSLAALLDKEMDFKDANADMNEICSLIR